MQIVPATGERPAVVPHHALVGHAVPVGVGEPEDLRRGGHVERAAEPQRALEHHEARGELRVAVERAVAVGVLEPQDPVTGIGLLVHQFGVRSARLRDVQPSVFVEGDRHGPLDEWR